ncbi:MAG: sensor histidine kinase [Pseudomonadota bacterium]
MDPQTPPSNAWRPWGEGPFARWPRTADAVLAIVVFLATLFHSSEDPNQDFVIRALGDVPIAGFIVIAVAGGALYWRRYQPLLVLGMILAAEALSTGLGYSYDFFGLPIALYSVGRYGTNYRWSYIGLGGAIALSSIGSLIDGAPLTDIGFGFVVLFLVWYMGSRIRIRAAQLEREKAAEARRAVAEERTRIARELHDIVAHQVSLMTVQAGAAKTVADDDPEGAMRAMEAVEKAGRQALDELRHLMGVLRPKAEVGELGPQPGLADVPRLVEHLGEAGLEVSLTIDGGQSNLPARVDLSTYRIVQEALTNVLKHAGPGTRTEVRLSIDSNDVAIEVLNYGHGATILPGAGHGILGMRERVQLLDGTLDAGPRPGGGFRVVAHLPIGDEPI